MNECLVKKYKGSVNNENLRKFGEVRIFVNDSGATDNFLVTASNRGGLVAKCLKGTFHDGTTTIKSCNKNGYIQDNGGTGVIISIDNKYNLNGIGNNRFEGRINLIGDLEQLSYCEDLKVLSFLKSGDIPEEYQVTGSLDSLSNLTKLTHVNINRDVGNITGGSVDSFKNCTQMIALKIDIVGGHLSSTTNMNSLQNLFLVLGAASGNLSEIGGKNTLTRLKLYGNNSIFGNISDLNNHAQLTYIDIHGAGMTHITGTLESLVGTGAMASRSSGTLTVVCCANITLNGVEVGDNVTKTYNFSTHTWS